MAKKTGKKPIKLTIATAEAKSSKPEGILFYLLPPLLVVAVFLYCANAHPHMLPPPEQPEPEQPMSEEEREFIADIEDEMVDGEN